MPTPKQSTAPRLGSSSLRITFNDKTGFTVTHGSTKDYILAHKPADKCSGEEWDRLWYLFTDMGIERPTDAERQKMKGKKK